MKIAFDVKGTLIGYNQEQVRRLFHILQGLGHEMYVWSSVGSIAYDAVDDLGLKAEAMTKYMKSDALEEEWMDLAIEDDVSQDYLAAKKIVFVSELPETIERFAEKMLFNAKSAKKLDD